MLEILQQIVSALVVWGFVIGLGCGWYLRGCFVGAETRRDEPAVAPSAAPTPSDAPAPPPAFTALIAHLDGGWRGAFRSCAGCDGPTAVRSKELATSCRVLFHSRTSTEGTLRKVSSSRSCCGSFAELDPNEDVTYRLESFIGDEATIAYGRAAQRIRAAGSNIETIAEVGTTDAAIRCEMLLSRVP